MTETPAREAATMGGDAQRGCTMAELLATG